MTLHIESLCQSYGDHKVIDGVSFDVEKGKVVSVLGPNGSGKSTLIRTVCGIMAPKGGTVKNDDKAVSDMTPKEISRCMGWTKT